MKLLIIRAGALGDTLMLMPLINALKGYRIDILGRKPGIDYLEPYVDQCIDIERGGWHRLFSQETDFADPLFNADHVIAFINDKENIVSDNLSHLFPGSKINIFPPFPDPDSSIHVALQMLYNLKLAGLPVDPEKEFNEVFVSPVMTPVGINGKKIVIHPGSGSKKKNYPFDFWLDLFIHIRKNSDPNMDICFLLGPVEEDMVTVIKHAGEMYDAEIVICPEKEELLSILNSANLYIGHDSGVTHLAAMLGIKTIALFKSSSVKQWHPLGPSVGVIAPDSSNDRLWDKVIKEVINRL